LAGNSDEEISSPLYATAVGLVMNSIQNKTQSAVKFETTVVPEKVTFQRERIVEKIEIVEETPAPVVELETVSHAATQTQSHLRSVDTIPKPESTEAKIRRSFFDKYVDKIKDFLDNAE